MNLRDFEYLIAVTELRNFSKAARKCNTSQPTLSGQIKKMEEYLGVQLFERTNKKVFPTETGIKITEIAKNILLQVDEIKETARSSKNPLGGDFKLAAFPTLASYILPKIVPTIKNKMPELKLILIEDKTNIILEMLSSGRLDAAFLALPIHDDNLDYKELFEDKFYLATPKDHILSKETELSYKKLQDYQLLLLEEGHCMRDQALDLCQITGADENMEFRATSLETLRQMVRAGTGITLIPEIAIEKSDGDIRYIPFKSPEPKRKIALVWRKSTPKSEIINNIIELF